MNTPTVVIVGGGLAGLAAAATLAPRGFRVTILESRPRLGGRASSFTDPATGQLVDACQHVSMSCCTNLSHFLRSIGVEHLLDRQSTLWFMTPDRRISVFKADPWPAPFHLARSLASARYLTMLEKLRIAYGLAQLLLAPTEPDVPLLDWLLRNGQTQRTIDRYWTIVLTSALNESIENVGIRYARKVFRDGFVRHRDAYVLQIPKVPLGRLYGEELRAWLSTHSVTVRESAGVRQVQPGSPHRILLRDGTELSADELILAVPFDRVIDLLPAELTQQPFFSRVKQLQPSPITSVHLWFDRPVLPRPNLVLIECLGQWLFTRESSNPNEHYLQVVVSASRALRSLGREELQQKIVTELKQLLPACRDAKLLRSKVVTEHTATFSAVPGVDHLRPSQATPVPGLYLAGDWTDTTWPATMEGAVRSGYLASEALLANHGRIEKLIQPDL